MKANQGAAGVDGQSIAGFEANLSGNLYKLWNRLSSGSYFAPPVRRVDIPKASGGKRPLGIPTVADRIAQEVGAAANAAAATTFIIDFLLLWWRTIVPAGEPTELRWRLIQRNPIALSALPGDHLAEC